MDLTELKHVNTASVYKAGVLAGTITRSGSGIFTFSYLPDYTGAPIASGLPLLPSTGGQPPSSAAWGLPPFFTGLLPEGHRLTVLSRATKTSLSDDLTLLLAVGQDTPGDVQIVPADGSPTPGTPLVDPSAADFDLRRIVDTVDLTALPGVQPKVSAHMISTPVKTRGGGAIVKLNPSGYPHLIANELLHLQHAKTLRLPVAEASMIHDQHGIPGLLVKRFDRRITPDGSDVERIPFEDGAQVLNIHPSQKYSVTGEELVLALSRVCAAEAVAKRNLYLQFLFAWLTGNGDLHAKNVGVIGTPFQDAEIAPIYDISCTRFYGDNELALSVCGKKRRLKRQHWDEFAAAIGLPAAAAKSAQQLAIKAAAGIDLAQLPFSGSVLHGAQRDLRFRLDDLVR